MTVIYTSVTRFYNRQGNHDWNDAVKCFIFFGVQCAWSFYINSFKINKIIMFDHSLSNFPCVSEERETRIEMVVVSKNIMFMLGQMVLQTWQFLLASL